MCRIDHGTSLFNGGRHYKLEVAGDRLFEDRETDDECRAVLRSRINLNVSLVLNPD